MINNFSVYISDGTKTLSQICQELNLPIRQVIEVNSQSVSQIGSVRNYLSSLTPGVKVLRGLEIKIPQKSSGGLDSTSQLLIHSLETRDEKYSNPSYISPRDLAYRSTNKRSSVNLPKNPGNSSVINFGEFNCFFNIYEDGVSQGSWELPVYPQEFSDSNSAVFSSQSLFGRSVDYQVYQGSSRSVSFNLNLHEELVPHDLDYIHRIVARIQSSCYPGYSNGTVKPPEISFVIGRQFKTRGILEGCSANWKSPMIDGKLVNCDLNISVKETTGPYSGQQVRSMRGYR